MSWTDERVEIMKKLLREGLSAAEVAQRLGEGVTRSAVIGKASRIGFSWSSGKKHNTQLQRKRCKSPTQNNARNVNASRFGFSGNGAQRAAFNPNPEPYTPQAEIVIPFHERRSIHTLTESCCRWPIGDPRHDDFHFCGKEKIVGHPYCPVHARRAFAPAQPHRQAPTDVAGVRSGVDPGEVVEFLLRATTRKAEAI